MSIFNELKRRNVFRVGAAYLFAAWLLIQVAETIFPLFGFGETPARIVVIVLAIGFIPALILAWVFEFTPEGLKKEHEVDRTQPLPPQAGKKLDKVIMVVLTLALAYFVLERFVLTREYDLPESAVSATTDASIAVMPFRNLSSDPENEYFSDGMTEEVLNLLSNIPELRVISRTSVFYYKDLSVPLKQVAEELNVAHVLQGSVRKSTDRVRISVQLVDARSDKQLWSRTWDRFFTDIFEMQDEVATEIVTQLQQTLDISSYAPRLHPTDNLEAYSRYLLARQLWWEREPTSVKRAIELFEEAIELDPGFALAHAGLASALYIDSGNNPLRRPEEWRERAKRAHELDPSLGEPLLLEGDYQISILRNGLEGISQFIRALELEPDSVWINHMAAIFWTAAGDIKGALPLSEKAQRLDPMQHNVNAVLGKVHLLLGNDEQAIHFLDRAADLGYASQEWIEMVIAKSRAGDVKGAQAAAANIVELSGISEAYIESVIGLIEHPGESPPMTAAELAGLPSMLRFDICLRYGNLECAFDAFQTRMAEPVSVPPFSLIWLEEARPLRQHPNFVTWMQNFNWPVLMDYWTSQRWPEACPNSVDTLDCS